GPFPGRPRAGRNSVRKLVSRIVERPPGDKPASAAGRASRGSCAAWPAPPPGALGVAPILLRTPTVFGITRWRRDAPRFTARRQRTGDSSPAALAPGAAA